MKYLGIIPARHASTRLPGKPLLLIGDKPMIQWVYEQVSKVLEAVIVATDHEGIFNCVVGFGGKAVMTSPDHPSGTDRCAEAAKLYSEQSGQHFEVIINIQGDEPFVQASQLLALMQCFEPDFEHNSTQIATLIKAFDPLTENYKDLENSNTPKVIVKNNGEAIAFSRSIIPYLRGIAPDQWLNHHQYYKHIGLYAYRSSVLHELTQLQPSSLEKAESLEQMRWIEQGYSIQTALSDEQTIGIDTPEDLEHAQTLIYKKH